MDPDANLTVQRDIAKRIIAREENGESVGVHELATDANRLAELVVALDEWIMRGGFLPMDWQNRR